MIFTKKQKQGPFVLEMVRPESPYFSTLLALAVDKLPELPDFSEDTQLGVFTDFGGEHDGAEFATYSVLIVSLDKIDPFQRAIESLRQRHGILKPYSEFAYKKLANGARRRALGEFLKIVDSFLHGLLVTVAVDKEMKTVFGDSKHRAHAGMTAQLASLALGTWKGDVAEKAGRVCHTIAAFLSLVLSPHQRVLWYCDNDSINQDSGARTFENTRELFGRVLGMYTRCPIEHFGFAKSFEEKSHYDDLLSVTDFAAGVVQDLLRHYKTGEDQLQSDERAAVMRWIANRSEFLTKATVQIVPLPGGEAGVGTVEFSPAAPSADTAA